MYPDLLSYPHIPGSAININAHQCRICIATEDIVGPIRNGGIGTTYMYLALLLAKSGFDTTILYLKGNYCENGTLDQWINYYKERDINFVPLPWSKNIVSGSTRWVDPMYSLYVYLKNNHFDVVHMSEWHGTGYVSLLAKKLSLQFDNTVFCVKASSPWLWNREHGCHLIRDKKDLLKIHSEKGSIEYADIVIGGSAHLLEWMRSHDYSLPEKTYVQPNVMIPTEIGSDLSRADQYGTLLNIDEIVFFGRLEYRKGLEVFIDSLEILKQKVELPKIIFTGKYGERIPSYSEYSIKEYISLRMNEIGCGYEIITNLNTTQVIQFLLEKNRLAIMPSLIENSSLAIYEAAYFGIPFIASNRGGNPELVDERYRSEVLVEPYPVPLARKIEQKLKKGAIMAAPSFDNNINLDVWKQFHEKLLKDISLIKDNDKKNYNIENRQTVSIIIYVYNDISSAKDLLNQITGLENVILEIIIINDGSFEEDCISWLRGIRDNTIKVVHAEHWGREISYNTAAEYASSDYLVFLDQEVIFEDSFFNSLGKAITSKHDIYTFCYRDYTNSVVIDFIEHASFNYYSGINIPLVVVKKASFMKVNGFDGLYKVGGSFNSLVSKMISQNFTSITVPEPLFKLNKPVHSSQNINITATPFRSVYPLASSCNYDISLILLSARGLVDAASKHGTADSGHSGHSGLLSTSETEIAVDTAYRLPVRASVRNFLHKMYRLQITVFRYLIASELKLLRIIFRIT